MEELLKLALQYLPITILVAAGALYVFLVILKEIKIIFFDKGREDERFGTRLKYVFFFWLKRRKKAEEPDHIHYSNKEREKVISDLLIHNFFQAINNIKMRIPNMKFGEGGEKNEILRDVIRIYVETIEKYTIAILKNHKLDGLTTSKLNEILLQEIEKAEFEIHSKTKERLGHVLYKMIMEDPLRGFYARNATFREIFIDGVLLISSQAMSVYEYDNYDRASEILTSMYISLRVIIKNFEQVFKDFNGTLDEYLDKI